jgi:hypothetical protein
VADASGYDRGVGTAFATIATSSRARVKLRLVRPLAPRMHESDRIIETARAFILGHPPEGLNLTPERAYSIRFALLAVLGVAYDGSQEAHGRLGQALAALTGHMDDTVHADLRAEVARAVAIAADCWRWVGFGWLKKTRAAGTEEQTIDDLLRRLRKLHPNFHMLTTNDVREILRAHVTRATARDEEATDKHPHPKTCRISTELSVRCRAFGDELRSEDLRNPRGQWWRLSQLYQRHRGRR